MVSGVAQDINTPFGVINQMASYIDDAIDEAAERMDRPTVTGDAISHYQRIGAGQPAVAFC